ncbi:MAG: dUTP diphosphatase [Candidatus Sumerlaeota bacterium]
MENVIVEILREEGCCDLPLPHYATEGSAGLDLRAAVEEPLRIEAGGGIALVPTGLRIAVPQGYEVQLRPRSGLALRHGITLPNSPATIDSDYRGPVNVIVANYGPEDFEINRGDRIAQMVLAKVERLGWREVDSLSQTVRGHGGFGHTGLE